MNGVKHIGIAACLMIAQTLRAHNGEPEFVENQGQFHENARFKAELPGGAVFLERQAWTYHFCDFSALGELHGSAQAHKHPETFQHHAYKVNFVNSNPDSDIVPSEKQPHVYNYFKGEKSNWASQVPVYQKLRYHDLYSGIDLELYTQGSSLKYDWLIEPGADPSKIKLHIEGAEKLRIQRGRLEVTTTLGEMWEEKPYAFQIIEGDTVEVACQFKLSGEYVRFEFPHGYQSERRLIIDPVLIFSTYTGSVSNNFGCTATFDQRGYLYSGSTSFGIDYPTTLGAFQTAWAGGSGGNGGTDVAITKYDTTGTSMIYSTYLGGSEDEIPHSLIVNENDELYVMGTTGSLNFPVTFTAFDFFFANNPNSPVNLPGMGVEYTNSSDVFVTKFNAAGDSIIASTFLGGGEADGLNLSTTLKRNYADEIRGEIELDLLGNVYVVSSTVSANFPTTSGSFQPNKPGAGLDPDGFVVKLSPDLDQLLWGSFIGGQGADAIYSIAIDENNDIYISGGTASANFPTDTNAYQASLNGGADAFILHINQTGDSILNATFFGSPTYDQSYFVEVDQEGSVYLFGQTTAQDSLLIINAGYGDPNSGQFVSKFTAELDSVIWSTVFGSGDGDPDISPTAFLVDVCSAVYLSGWGSSIQGGNLSTSNLIATPGAFQSQTDDNDFYLLVLSNDASQLEYASFIGGSAAEHVDGGTSRFDRKGIIYQSVCAGCPSAGQGSTSDFPTLPNPGAFSNSNGAAPINGCNAASFKLDFEIPIVLADYLAPEAGCAPLTVNFDNTSLTQNATVFLWDFDDGTTSTATNPTHTFTQPGTYNVMLAAADTGTCNFSDTLYKQITVLADTNYTLPTTLICAGQGQQIGITNNNNPNVNYTWKPSAFLSDTTIANPIANPPGDVTYQLVVDNGICSDTIAQTITVDTLAVQVAGDSAICSVQGAAALTAQANGTATYVWSSNSSFSDTLNTNLNSGTASVVPTDSLNAYFLLATNSNGCSVVETFEVNVLDLDDPLVAQIDAPLQACLPDTVSLNNSTQPLAATSYLWQLPNGSSTTAQDTSFYFTQKGNFTIQLIAIDSSICPQIDTARITISVDADSSYTIIDRLCPDSLQPIGVAPDSSGSFSYNWFPVGSVSNDTLPNPRFSTNSDTALTLLISDGFCTDSVTNQIQVSQVVALTNDSLLTCSTQFPVTISGSSVGTGTKFIWSSNANLTDTLNTNLQDSTATLTPSSGVNTFWFSAINAEGCPASTPLTLLVSDRLIDARGVNWICAGDTIALTANSAIASVPFSYQWEPQNALIGASNQASVLAAPVAATTFTVIATDTNGCIAEDSVAIDISRLNARSVEAYANPDTVLRDESTELFAEPLDPAFTYQWFPIEGVTDPTSPGTTVTVNVSTVYTVSITDPQSGCSFLDSVAITVAEIVCGPPEIFVPTAFTPDNDGFNDELRVRGKNISELTFSVYNRWGELVFETNRKERGWNGQFNGKPADQQVFVYYLEAICIDGQKYRSQGDVTLLR